MAKGFKLRISLPSPRFCRSKKHSCMPKSPSVGIAYPKLPAPPPSTPNHPLSKRNLSKVLSFGSSGCLLERSIAYISSLCNVDWPAYKMTKDYDSVQKLCNSPAYSEDLDESVIMWPVDPFNSENYNGNDFATSFILSFSSADSNKWFSSEDCDQQNENESEGLLSSCSNSESISEEHAYESRKKKNAKQRRLKHYASNNGWKDGGDQRITTAAMPETEIESVAVKKNVFGRLIPRATEGKVKESYAVMKKSTDPREDFKKSMIEMVLDKQISEPEELEKLLMCFLTLNTREHHAVIVDAFTEIWEELFYKSELELKEEESIQLSQKF